MKIKNLKYIICIFKGHKINNPSIINLPYGNYLCKCDRCDLYEAWGDVGRITVSERWALNVKKEFEELKKLEESIDKL